MIFLSGFDLESECFTGNVQIRIGVHSGFGMSKLMPLKRISLVPDGEVFLFLLMNPQPYKNIF